MLVADVRVAARGGDSTCSGERRIGATFAHDLCAPWGENECEKSR